MSSRKLFSIFSNSYTITFSSFDHTIPVPSAILWPKGSFLNCVVRLVNSYFRAPDLQTSRKILLLAPTKRFCLGMFPMFLNN